MTLCGSYDPKEMTIIIAEFRKNTSLPIIAQPNGGKQQLINDKTQFNITVNDFTAIIAACIQSGATIVGGCCGTTPELIKSIADKFAGSILKSN